MMNWKAQIRLVSRVFAATFLAFFIVAAILFGLVQTNWGVRELARWVSSLEGELTFMPGKVSGVFPFRFALEQLSVSDAKGVWLEARGIKVRWSPLPLIQGRVYFEELVAGSVNLDRLPAPGNGTDGSFPSWIFAFRWDRFTIDRLSVGKDWLGQPAVLKLDARIPLSSPGDNVEAFLRVERVDRAGSLLQAKATAQAVTRFLRLDMSFDEERGGLFGKALGVEGPLSFSLAGEGTSDLWQGKLLAGILPFGRLSANLEVKGAENPLVKLRGRLHPTPETMPSILRIWIDRELPFELETRLRWPSALGVELLALQTPEVDLVLKGNFDLDQLSSVGQFNLTCADLKPLTEVLDIPTAGRLVSQGTFSTMDKILRFSVTGSAQDFQAGDSERALGKNFSWQFRGEGSATGVVSIKELKIGAENLLLEGSGEMRIPEPAAAMDALFEIRDLQKISSLGFLAGWSTQGRAIASWNHESSALTFQGKLRPAAGVTPAFLAEAADYAGTLSLENGTTLNLTRLELVVPWGKFQGEGKAHLPQERLEATWHLLLPSLGPLSTALKGGPAEVRGTVQGPFKALTLSADATVRGLSVSGFHFDTGHAALQSELGAVIKGNVKTDAEVKQLPFRGQADFDLAESTPQPEEDFLGGRQINTGRGPESFPRHLAG